MLLACAIHIIGALATTAQTSTPQGSGVVQQDGGTGQPEPHVEIFRVLYDGTQLPFEGLAVPPLGRRDIELRFRVVGLPSSDSLYFAFRMDGMDEEWSEVRSRASAIYVGLKPGSYTFQVRAYRPSGGWESSAELPVVIRWHTYEKPWFIALGVIFLLTLIGGAYGWQRWQGRIREETLARLVDERTQALQQEKARTETALEKTQQERETAQRALVTVEEQAIQLLRMDHMKSRLFANISHEFRTPLTLILDPIDRALSGAFGPLNEPGCRSLEMARQNAQRLLHLINQLLDLAKLEAGSMQPRMQKVDFIPFVRQATETFVSEAERRGIGLRFQATEPQLPVYIDVEKMEKVLYNLVTNALKATAPGGKVIVSVHASDSAHSSEDEASGHAVIVVRDTGEGIAEDELPFIFDRFYQAETGRLKGGTGIGLSLVREMVDLHGGSVHVESVHGFGSTFTVRIPLGRAYLGDHEVEDEPPPEPTAFSIPVQATTAVAFSSNLEALPETATNKVGEAPDDHRPLVLVAEDNPEIRQLIVDHLSPHYQVVEAEEGTAALRIARERRPALIVSDVLMPGMDGLALCRRIKTDEHLGDIPLILLTARASKEDRLEALQTGADDFLTKPFSAAELLARAENLIQSRAVMRERYSEEVVLPTTGQIVPSADAAFLERVYTAINEHLGNEGFTVGQLAAEMGLSESSLKRRLRSLVGMPPVEFIRARRLERAAALLLGKAGTVGEVAAQVGFESPSYFAKCFRERYGVSPSAYTEPLVKDVEGNKPA
ncbi:MAG TPA: ATP-binding protein [Rhodothermales bacterium]|nr:ATP-binding protein [Rhodothermales bacterium]